MPIQQLLCPEAWLCCLRKLSPRLSSVCSPWCLPTEHLLKSFGQLTYGSVSGKGNSRSETTVCEQKAGMGTLPIGTLGKHIWIFTWFSKNVLK